MRSVVAINSRIEEDRRRILTRATPNFKEYEVGHRSHGKRTAESSDLEFYDIAVLNDLNLILLQGRFFREVYFGEIQAKFLQPNLSENHHLQR